MTSTSNKPHDIQALDALTGGAFTAPTAGERAQRVRDWLARGPAAEQLQEVFKELSGRDKGAARLVREKLDEARRARDQAAIAAEWEQKAQALLELPRMNIADAMAWQRDAAKAGAPLSREPLASLRQRLAERVKGVEDLQHRVQVHREAAVLLVQRFEVLSTKGWQDAQATGEALAADVAAWKDQAAELAQDPNWNSLDTRLAPQLDASRAQLLAVSDAFQAALVQAVAAAADAAAPLPPVPVWADELRAARGLPPEAAQAAAAAERPAPTRAPKVDPAVRAAAMAAVQAALDKLKEETAQGHGKGTASAAAALRAVLKEHGRLVEPALEGEVHAALVAAGELEGWQRWSADKVREELVAKAEALLQRPEGQALGGRKMQESLRTLRDQWKKADQGGVPNHALWKRFDEACNEAHKVVEAWLEKVRADAAEHKALRVAMIDELKAWAEAHAQDDDFKAHNRTLHQFADRWRQGGHVGEKVFAELQTQWAEAMSAARAPLDAAQKASVDRRQAMIAEATELGAAAQLRIDAVKALQQRWQAEAQGVPLERRQEQKLWDAFRAPIDEAFNRKTVEREKAAAATSGVDRQVLAAAKALEAANADGDVQKIRAAVAALEAAVRGEQAAAAPVAAPAGQSNGNAAAAAVTEATADTPASSETPETTETPEAPAAESGAEAVEAAAAPAPAPAPAPRKPVVAVRGDDRPGARKPEAAADARGGRGGDRRDGRDSRGPRSGAERGGRFNDRFGDRERSPRQGEDRPRLGDMAFRAQRDAMDHAQMALRKLAAQAHGEALTQLMTAWEQRDAAQLPSVQELGRVVSPAVRGEWQQSLGAPAQAAGDAGESLLRLEMAAEVPTPAEQLEARRALQLKLLTRRGDPSPAQTWGEDVGKVLASAHDAGVARRLQAALKALLRR